MKLSSFFLVTSMLVGFTTAAHGIEPWKDTKLSRAERAKALVQAMTLDEKLQLVNSQYALGNEIPQGAIGSAGYVPAITRLGIPAQQITDAGLGVVNPGQVRPGDGATGLPSGQIISGSFDNDLANQAGVVLGQEAFHRGYNVLLGGGVVLVRDPRNGRNFEYLGEDPLLAGYTVADEVRGTQSQHVISTVKHYAFNNFETNRLLLDMKIDEQAGRESDLLAFEIATKVGEPGSIMCAYNKVNGIYSCENSYLLQLPKREWGFRGYVMTDWGAAHSTIAAAKAGLDQESATKFDREDYFGKPLKLALQKGDVPMGRLDNMAYRIVYTMLRVGAYDYPASPSTSIENVADHEAISQKIAESGITLLKNEGHILPLSVDFKNVAIIGGHADEGVLSGGGSSQVTARGGNITLKDWPQKWPGPVSYFPSSPMRAIQALDPNTNVRFNAGNNIKQAVELAKNSDVAIVFATKWSAEAFDNKDLKLPGKQNELIEAVAQTGKPVIVVLETGNPVSMPWLNDVKAVVAAWYPGTSGGKAIANILYGKVNPSGRLTTTWPVDLSQLPNSDLAGAGKLFNADPSVPLKHYPDNKVVNEIDLNQAGANVGYRWYEKQNLTPLYSFGYGLSYTTFAYKKLNVKKDFGSDSHRLLADVTVQNTGNRDGADVIQIYNNMPDGSPSRLCGYRKVFLKAGETQTVTLYLFPASMAHYDVSSHRWEIAPGSYELSVRPNALSNDRLTTVLKLDAVELPD